MRIEDELQVTSDASGSVGFRVFFQGYWGTDKWPQHWVATGPTGLTTDLTFLEFFPILVAICLGGGWQTTLPLKAKGVDKATGDFRIRKMVEGWAHLPRSLQGPLGVLEGHL